MARSMGQAECKEQDHCPIVTARISMPNALFMSFSSSFRTPNANAAEVACLTQELDLSARPAATYHSLSSLIKVVPKSCNVATRCSFEDMGGVHIVKQDNAAVGKKGAIIL